MDSGKIIDSIYGREGVLRDILLRHSRAVARKAVAVADSHPELGLDRQFLYHASMLHDIGIIRCDAPGIQCFGTEPYILHGRAGAAMLRAMQDEGCSAEDSLENYARVCERHTGTGLSREEIIARGLPLPQQDFMPETLEEQVICWADKFFSKTRPDDEKPLERVLASIGKFGEEGVGRFLEWQKRFETS